MIRLASHTAVVVLLASGCNGRDDARAPAQRVALAAPSRADEVPQLLNTELPFRYPAALYARKVQGSVTLRLFVDTNGNVMADSTRVEQSSGNVVLDSAAIAGSKQLRFVPAKARGEPIATAVLLPVFFRHPEAPPLPEDSLIR